MSRNVKSIQKIEQRILKRKYKELRNRYKFIADDEDNAIAAVRFTYDMLVASSNKYLNTEEYYEKSEPLLEAAAQVFSLMGKIPIEKTRESKQGGQLNATM